MRFIRDFLPHLSIAMLLGLVVLVILDEHNPTMKFLTSGTSKVYLLLLCALCLTSLILYVAEKRK